MKGNIEHGGDRKTKSRLQDVTLKNIGVSKIESHRLQRIAEIPEDRFESILLEAEAETKKV